MPSSIKVKNMQQINDGIFQEKYFLSDPFFGKYDKDMCMFKNQWFRNQSKGGENLYTI